MKIKKIPAFIIAAVLIASLMLGSVSAADVPNKGSYEKYKNYYSIANVSKDLLEGYFDSLSPEIDQLIDLYIKHSLYELTREEAITAMFKNFIEDYTDVTPYMGDSLLKAFDNFGGYYPNTSMSDLFSGNSYSGYGFILTGNKIINSKRYDPMIEHVIRNSPAESAGLLPGDRFISINGITIEGFGLDALSNMLASTSGLNKFVIKRGDEEIAVEMSKAAVKYESVSFRIIDKAEKLALLTISDFLDEMIPLELSAILGVLAEAGCENLIIDLRDNAGGDLEILYTILDYFVPEENVLLGTVEFNNGVKEDVFSTDYGFAYEKICVLTNEDTVSAAEAFALAISELADGVIIGETTYGKGIGQTYFELENGDVVGITSLLLVSPKGIKYHGDGVSPHIPVGMRVVKSKTDVKDEKFEQLNFVNCINIKKDADNSVILGLNQRLARIGYLTPDDVTSKCTQKTITAVEILQSYYGLPKGIDKIDYVFLEYLNYLVTYVPTMAVDGDAQMECALKFIREGEKAAKDFAKTVVDESKEIIEAVEPPIEAVGPVIDVEINYQDPGTAEVVEEIVEEK